MTARALPYFLIGATIDMATVMVGTLLLAGRRWQAENRLRTLSDHQLRDIGLNRHEVAPHTPFLHREIMRHELGRW
jgi:Domain of unknown function (DUF1127)